MSVLNCSLRCMVKRTLYALKRQYGGSIVFCSLMDADTDYRTGKKRVPARFVRIRRVVVLPSRMSRDAVASVARISVNKPLAYGGQFNAGDRGFIIDGSDMPDGWHVKKDDWIVCRSERYSIKMILRIRGDMGWMIVARKHPGVPFAYDLYAESLIDCQGNGAVS